MEVAIVAALVGVAGAGVSGAVTRAIMSRDRRLRHIEHRIAALERRVLLCQWRLDRLEDPRMSKVKPRVASPKRGRGITRAGEGD